MAVVSRERAEVAERDTWGAGSAFWPLASEAAVVSVAAGGGDCGGLLALRGGEVSVLGWEEVDDWRLLVSREGDELLRAGSGRVDDDGGAFDGEAGAILSV